jgi:hypothetical protein
MLEQNEDEFHRLSEAALKALRESKEHESLPLGMRRPNGPGKEAITGRHFLTYRSEASSTAVGTYWIKPHPATDLNGTRCW